MYLFFVFISYILIQNTQQYQFLSEKDPVTNDIRVRINVLRQ